MNFEPDPKVQQVADAYAADLVDLARDRLGVTLDFSIASVTEVERLAEQIYLTKPRFPGLHKDFAKVMDFYAKGIGFYLAETMRRSWGGEHGIVELNGSRFYGFRFPDGGLCWPVGRAQQRLADGRENDLVFYVSQMQPKVVES